MYTFTLSSEKIHCCIQDNNDNSEVCQSFAQNSSEIRNSSNDAFANSGDEALVVTDNLHEDKYPNLLWPFSIIFLVHTLSAVVYFILSKLFINTSIQY